MSRGTAETTIIEALLVDTDATVAVGPSPRADVRMRRSIGHRQESLRWWFERATVSYGNGQFILSANNLLSIADSATAIRSALVKHDPAVAAIRRRLPASPRFPLSKDPAADDRALREAFEELRSRIEGLTTTGHWPALYHELGELAMRTRSLYIALASACLYL